MDSRGERDLTEAERDMAVEVATKMVAALPAADAQTAPSTWLLNAEKEAEQELAVVVVVVAVVVAWPPVPQSCAGF